MTPVHHRLVYAAAALVFLGAGWYFLFRSTPPTSAEAPGKEEAPVPVTLEDVRRQQAIVEEARSRMAELTKDYGFTKFSGHLEPTEDNVSLLKKQVNPGHAHTAEQANLLLTLGELENRVAARKEMDAARAVYLQEQENLKALKRSLIRASLKARQR